MHILFLYYKIYNFTLQAINFLGLPAGTRTASAVSYAIDNRFGVEQGRRPNVPLVVQIITDGHTHDSRDIPATADRLQAVATNAFALGVGRSKYKIYSVLITIYNKMRYTNYSFTFLLTTRLLDQRVYTIVLCIGEHTVEIQNIYDQMQHISCKYVRLYYNL